MTFPDGDSPSEELVKLDLTSSLPVSSDLIAANGIVDTVKFEESRMTSASKTKVVTDGFSSEHASSNSAEMKRVQAGDLQYEESREAAARMKCMEVDGIKMEQNAALLTVGFGNSVFLILRSESSALIDILVVNHSRAKHQSVPKLRCTIVF